jgi:hypothetical protein
MATGGDSREWSEAGSGMKEHLALLVDADDTLWENNIYFERAFGAFCDFLAHSTLTAAQVRDVLNEIESVNATLHGYGSKNFGLWPSARSRKTICTT